MRNWKSLFGYVAAAVLLVPAQGVVAEQTDSCEAGARWEHGAQWESTAQWEQSARWDSATQWEQSATWESTPMWEATTRWESQQQWEQSARWESVRWEDERRGTDALHADGTHVLYAQGLVSFSGAR